MSSNTAIFVDLNKVLIPTNVWPEVFLHCLKKNPFATLRLLATPGSLTKNLDAQIAKTLYDVPYNEKLVEYLSGESRDVFIISRGFPELENMTLRKFSFLKGKGELQKDANLEVIDSTHHLVQFSGLSVKDILSILKPQQWVKNLLVFAPLVLAHEFHDSDKVVTAFLGFLSFCFMASIVYVINDIFDLQSDRIHLKKRHRPFTSCRVPLSYAPIFISVLLVLIGITSLFMTQSYIHLLGYLGLNILYSTYLKRMILLDVYVLSTFYIIRIFYGGHITGTELSHWIISFSASLFLSLALVKRYEECLHLYRKQGVKENASRGYNYGDLNTLSTIGIACGCISTLIFVMYINFSNPQQFYTNPGLLWPIGALLFYWITKIWIKVTRGEIKEDPLSYSLKDPESLIVFVSMIFLFLAASYL